MSEPEEPKNGVNFSRLGVSSPTTTNRRISANPDPVGVGVPTLMSPSTADVAVSSSGVSTSRWTPFEMECLLDLQRKMTLATSAITAESRSTSTNTSVDSAQHSPVLDRSDMMAPMLSHTDSAHNNPVNSVNNPVLWDHFENTAQAIAALYRAPNWSLFQHAAAATTQLYKESTDYQQRSFEQGMVAGRQRFVKELVGFIKSSTNRNKLYIKREDLLAFLTGKNRPNHSADRRAQGVHYQSPPRTNRLVDEEPATAINLFHEALARASGGNSPVRSTSNLRSSPSRSLNASSGISSSAVDLGSFLVDELRRNRKRRRSQQPNRNSSDLDASPEPLDSSPTQGSTNNKRFRFL